jgi:hypothetical protein
MGGEAAFVSARARAREHAALYSRVVEGRAALERKRDEVRARAAALQKERAGLCERLWEGRRLLASLEEAEGGRPSSASSSASSAVAAGPRPAPPTIDPAKAAEIALRIAAGTFPLPGWQPWMSLDATPADIASHQSEESAATTAKAAQRAADAEADSAARAVARGAAAPMAEEAAPAPAQPQPQQRAPAPAVAAPAPAPAPAPAAIRTGAASVAGGAGAGAAAAAPPAVPFLRALQALPPAARADLLRLFPPGWKPGDPLPANLPDLRALLAKHGVALGGGAGAK